MLETVFWSAKELRNDSQFQLWLETEVNGVMCILRKAKLKLELNVEQINFYSTNFIFSKFQIISKSKKKQKSSMH